MCRMSGSSWSALAIPEGEVVHACSMQRRGVMKCQMAHDGPRLERGCWIMLDHGSHVGAGEGKRKLAGQYFLRGRVPGVPGVGGVCAAALAAVCVLLIRYLNSQSSLVV